MLRSLGPEGKLMLNFVGGKLEHGSGAAMKVLEPGKGTILTECNESSSSDVQQAVQSASAGQLKWSSHSWLERGDVLRRTAQLIKENCEELAQWESRDNGKPIYEAGMDVMSCVDTFHFYAGIGQNLAGQYVPLSPGRFAFTTREPLGIVACIGAWNYPIQTCSWKTAPALACGNAVVYKPSPLAPISAVLLGMLLKQAGLPDGAFNVVQGGGQTGSALIDDPLVKKVSFTGSIPTGKSIMKSCAERRIKPVTMELGGKSALIICADADIDQAVTGAMMANFFSQGQVCSNASKVLVHKSILAEFQQKIVEKTKAMVVGNPLDEETRVGAHISEEHRGRVEKYIRDAVAAGATLLCGGERISPRGLEAGFYLSPCILSGVTETFTIYKEEVFGSVLLLLPFDDEEEAIRIANNTDMGLAGGVFTKDLAKAHGIAGRIHAGNVYVNTFNDVSPFVPFGGFGESGFGRENGIAALEHYTQYKSVFVNTHSPLENPF